jgi:chromosomal replication initiator protein
MPPQSGCFLGLELVDGIVEEPIPGGPADCRASCSSGAAGPATLSSFVIGPENYLAMVAVRSLLDDAEGTYNPVFFYGPSGTGKSFLALALVGAWKTRFRRRAVYTTARDFAYQLADAIQTRTVDDFATSYCQASLLAIDDLEHLVGKPAAQRELVCILDALCIGGSRLLLTAHKAPPQLEGISPALRSRMGAGLTVPLNLPGRDARLVVLERLAQSQRVELPKSAARLLADLLNAPVPALRGAISQLDTLARSEGAPITVDTVRRYITNRDDPREISLGDIASVAARQFSLTLAELRGPSRRRTAATARGVAMYLARSTTNKSLKSIGQYFGRRDHSTVSYGCRKLEERFKKEPEMRHVVLDLIEKLEGRQRYVSRKRRLRDIEEIGGSHTQTERVHVRSNGGDDHNCRRPEEA